MVWLLPFGAACVCDPLQSGRRGANNILRIGRPANGFATERPGTRCNAVGRARCEWDGGCTGRDQDRHPGRPERRQQRGGAVGGAVGRAGGRGDQRQGRHPGQEGRARGRRRRQRRRRRAEGLRLADLPEEGQRADLDGDERGAQRRPADRHAAARRRSSTPRSTRAVPATRTCTSTPGCPTSRSRRSSTTS